MGKIAQEMNLAESAFILKSERADFRARYFTPAVEIPMAGHPTLSVIFALIHAHKIKLDDYPVNVTLEVKAAILPIEIQSKNGELLSITMQQIKPKFLEIVRQEEVLPVFGLQEIDFTKDVPIQIVSTGTNQLMVPVKDIETLERIVLNVDAFANLRARYDFMSIHAFTVHGYTQTGDTYARHFDIPPDLIEDPFTGSATGGMAAYLWRYHLIDESQFIAEQGHTMGRPGQAEVLIIGKRENIEGIKVGGKVVLVAEGVIYVDEPSH